MNGFENFIEKNLDIKRRPPCNAGQDKKNRKITRITQEKGRNYGKTNLLPFVGGKTAANH